MTGMAQLRCITLSEQRRGRIGENKHGVGDVSSSSSAGRISSIGGINSIVRIRSVIRVLGSVVKVLGSGVLHGLVP